MAQIQFYKTPFSQNSPLTPSCPPPSHRRSSLAHALPDVLLAPPLRPPQNATQFLYCHRLGTPLPFLPSPLPHRCHPTGVRITATLSPPPPRTTSAPVAPRLSFGSAPVACAPWIALTCSPGRPGARPDHKWPMRPLSLHLPGRSMLGWRF